MRQDMINLLNTLAFQIIKNAYTSRDIATLNSLGIDESALKTIGEMNSREFSFVLNHQINIVNTTIDVDLLKKCIERSKTINDQHTMIQEAVILGATREIMKTYAKISFKQFNEIKKQLAIHNQRTSFANLNDEQILLLDEAIKVFLKNNASDSRIKLRIFHLIDLAKTTNLPIKAILTHISEYWNHSYEL